MGIRQCGVTAVFVLGVALRAEAPDHARQGHPRLAAPLPVPSDATPPTGLTHGDWGQLRRAVEASEYHASPVSKPGKAPALQAPNRRQAYRTTFRADGIEIVPRAQAGASWRLGVSVSSYGYEGEMRAVAHAQPHATRDRVEYRRGSLTEWYVNRPTGLEQGFELQEPRPRRAGPLILAVAVTGDLEVSVDDDGASFANRSGETRIRYAGLKAWDAEGRPLESRLEAAARAVRIVVEAQHARFPVTVDPVFVHEAELLGHPDAGQAGAGFGFSVSVSGKTAVVGEPFVDTLNGGAIDVGAVDVFVRTRTGWTLRQRLLAHDGSPGDYFGYSVSISGDTILVGAVNDSDATTGVHSGSAYVFVRYGATWNQQQKLSASDGAAYDNFGNSVSISGDTAMVGAPRDDTSAGLDAGSAHVFVRSGTTWTEQQKLVASDGSMVDNFGMSVSLATDTAVVGADSDDTPAGEDAGSAYVFVRSGAAWTEQQRLLAADGAAGDHLGQAVAVSADTLVLGAWGCDTASGPDAGCAYVYTRSGSTWTEDQKLMASDGAISDNFGHSVSISGDTVMAGADQAPGGKAVGAAYVFVRSGTTWLEEQKLLAEDGAVSDAFGIAVSMDANTMLIGAHVDDLPGGANAGSAYLFVRSGTVSTQRQKLVSPDRAGTTAQEIFGYSVSVSGDVAVVGAPFDDVWYGQEVGSAYIFVRSGETWTEQEKLYAPDGAAGDWFGIAVSIAGDTLVVGANRDDVSGAHDAGSAYVFVRSGTTWIQQQKLVASGGSSSHEFGASVSISGDTVVVGANLDSSAYVFVRSGTTWVQQQRLVPSGGSSSDWFGISVSVSGDTAVVGARQDDPPAGMNAGSAYVFVRSGTTWTQQQKIVASDGAANDSFGCSVSISGDTVVVGAYGHDIGGSLFVGSAYVFVRSGATWTEQQHLLASDATAFADFGFSVSISGDVAVIGADRANAPGAALAGAAYVFARTGATWAQHQKLVAPDAAGGDRFGFSVAASVNNVLVGAIDDDTAGGTSAGSAHVFRRVLASDLGNGAAEENASTPEADSPLEPRPK